MSLRDVSTCLSLMDELTPQNVKHNASCGVIDSRAGCSSCINRGMMPAWGGDALSRGPNSLFSLGTI